MKKRTFPRGVHPPEAKTATGERPIDPLPPPERVLIPLLQHFGSPARPLVSKGQEVSLGEMLGEATGLFSAHVHSSVSGKVLAVEEHGHSGGYPMPTVVIANDAQDRVASGSGGAADAFSLSPDEIRQKVKAAAVVGLGGAAFPTAVKLSPPKDKPIDILIVNGCECEPMLTADYRLMLEHPGPILKGAELARLAVGAQKTIIGIEDNKPDAAEALRREAEHLPAEIHLLKTKYPQGAEKNLIYALLRREVPRGGLPFDVGIVVQNVGTAKAIWEAVTEDKPLYERVITVGGPGIREPKNLLARVGTPFRTAVEFCGGLQDDANTIIMGGPMMGLAQWSLDTPIVKGTSGILAWNSPDVVTEYPCIRCGRCIEHCPMGLSPTQLHKFVRYDKAPSAESWGILDCVECGCCQYICPSKIPLVHWLRLGKNQISREKKRKSS